MCWAIGEYKETEGTDLIVQCQDDGEYFSIEQKNALKVHPSCLDGVDDLLKLGDFNEGSLLHTIRTRYGRQ